MPPHIPSCIELRIILTKYYDDILNCCSKVSGNFHVKNNLLKNLHGVKFSQLFDPRNFLMVDAYNMDDCLEHLVYYQVSGETGIAGRKNVVGRSSRQSEFYLQRCGHAHRC